MKVHKITVYVIDHDSVGGDEAARMIESARYPNHCLNPHTLSVETVEIGEWHDEHPLNKRDLYRDELSRLFGGNS